MKVEKTDAVRHLIIREENDKLCKVQEKYKIVVRDDKLATEIISLWNEPYEFDDLAFKIKIIKVKRGD